MSDSMSEPKSESALEPSAVDIAIVGGGMVGASLAALLGKHFRVAMIEKFDFRVLATPPKDQETATAPSFNARGIALSQSSQAIFEKMGIWPRIAQEAQSIKDVHVSDKGRWGSVLLEAERERLNDLGFVIEASKLGQSLFEHLNRDDSLDLQWHMPANLSDFKLHKDGVCLTLSNDTSINAKLMIVCDGANSALCETLGIQTQTTDYEHTAITTTVITDKPHQAIAYERFTSNGPMALLPLPNFNGLHRSALVWTCPHEQAEQLLSLGDDAFLQSLQSTFGSAQGQFVQVGKRDNFDLKLSTATEQVRNHIVVMGNAAHSLHPVAGQGFNLALRDAQCLSDVLVSALAKGDADWHKLAVLSQYEQQQKMDQQLTTLFSDALPQIFSSRLAPVKMGRTLGLLALEILPGVKSRFVSFATGFR